MNVMQVEAKLFQTETDYETYKSWWDGWGKKAPERDLLPTTGCVVLKEGKPVFAGFVYTSNSKLGWIGFFCGDPKASARTRVGAMVYAIEFLESTAQVMGLRALMAFSDQPAITKVMHRRGYKVLSLHHSLMKVLGE